VKRKARKARVITDPIALGFSARTIALVRHLAPNLLTVPKLWPQLSRASTFDVSGLLPLELAPGSLFIPLRGVGLWDVITWKTLFGSTRALRYFRAHLGLPNLTDDEMQAALASAARALGDWQWLAVRTLDAMRDGRIPRGSAAELCRWLAGQMDLLEFYVPRTPPAQEMVQYLRSATADEMTEWWGTENLHPAENAVSRPVLEATLHWTVDGQPPSSASGYPWELEGYVAQSLVALGEVVREEGIASRGGWRGVADGIDGLLARTIARGDVSSAAPAR
jgi:hypothetical protein